MSRNADETVTLCCPLNALEQAVVAEMMRMTGITSEANIVRLGLYHLARHLKVDIDEDVFLQRLTRKATSRLTA